MRSGNIWKNVEFLALLYIIHASFFIFFVGIFALPFTLIAKHVPLIQDPALESAIAKMAGPEPLWVFYPGFVLTLVFLPLDLALLVNLAHEYKKEGNVRNAFDRALKDFPEYFFALNALVAIGFFAPFLFPFTLMGLYYWKKGKIDLKIILLTVLIIIWAFYGHGITYYGTLEERRTFYVATLFLIPLGVYFFSDDDGHGLLKNEETDLR